MNKIHEPCKLVADALLSSLRKPTDLSSPPFLRIRLTTTSVYADQIVTARKEDIIEVTKISGSIPINYNKEVNEESDIKLQFEFELNQNEPSRLAPISNNDLASTHISFIISISNICTYSTNE